MEAHELASLKDRLTPAQQEGRRARLHRRGLGRIDLERSVTATQAGMVQAFGTVDERFKNLQTRMYRQNIAAWGVIGVLAVVLALKVFGAF